MNTYPQVGTIAPQFTLKDQDGKMHTLAQYAGKQVLLYFYPKDDTPGCTTEACTLRDSFADFEAMGMVVLGVSRDDEKKHKKFQEKYNLPFALLADTEGSVCETYGVWQLKKFMGKEYMGISRVSFLIDEAGKVKKVYETVKPAEHAGEVLVDARLEVRA
jgi:thioredoxin-dependent peroxiredoxin